MKLALHRLMVRLTVFSAVLLLLNCTSRLRLNLQVTDEGATRRVNVDQTQFAPRTILGGSISESQLRSGEGNCVIILASTRSKMQSPSGRYDVLRYDEVLRYRVFLQLPSKLAVGNWPLGGHSLVQIMGRYELTEEDKSFAESSGTMAIDSLAGKRAFMSVDGEFKNPSGATLVVKGQFKVKIK